MNIDFNQDVILEGPPVQIGKAKPVRVSFGGAEDQGRVWLMVDAEYDEDEPWIAIEGNQNCRRLGEMLIAWANAAWLDAPEGAEFSRYWMSKRHWFRRHPTLTGMWQKFEGEKWMMTPMDNCTFISLEPRP